MRSQLDHLSHQRAWTQGHMRLASQNFGWCLYEQGVKETYLGHGVRGQLKEHLPQRRDARFLLQLPRPAHRRLAALGHHLAAACRGCVHFE